MGKEKALEYFKKADRIAFSSEEKFVYYGRGEFWVNILYSLQELNRKDEKKSLKVYGRKKKITLLKPLKIY